MTPARPPRAAAEPCGQTVRASRLRRVRVHGYLQGGNDDRVHASCPELPTLRRPLSTFPYGDDISPSMSPASQKVATRSSEVFGLTVRSGKEPQAPQAALARTPLAGLAGQAKAPIVRCRKPHNDCGGGDRHHPPPSKLDCETGPRVQSAQRKTTASMESFSSGCEQPTPPHADTWPAKVHSPSQRTRCDLPRSDPMSRPEPSASSDPGCGAAVRRGPARCGLL